MENPNLFKENPSTAYNSAAVAAAGGANTPMPTVVIELKKDEKGNIKLDPNGPLAEKDGKYFLQNLQSGTRYILKTDAYIDYGTKVPDDVEFVLDGGNLHRDENTKYLPKKITCINGSFIDDASGAGGLACTHIVGARENTSVKNFHSQTNYVVEFNMMDFVHSEDYQDIGTSKSINLNNVLERIFSSIYNDKEYQPQRMVIKMPETFFGKHNFFVNGPITLKHNVTLDLSGAVVFLSNDFNPGPEGGKFGDRYVFSFETNHEFANLATSAVKNVEIKLDENLVDSNCPEVIFNLTNFSGVMENVKIDLNNLEKYVVALWQPYGTPDTTYSDRKIIRRCMIDKSGWRTKTPTVVFSRGDGCIIEQCKLGYVAIIGGKGYTIRGCLNDSYFLYDTTVDFTGSYWEIGQFQILDSKVRFSACRLDCQNNNYDLVNKDGKMARRYTGPWMAVDTEGCRDRLRNMLTELNLGDVNFNDIKAGIDENHANYRKYMAHVTSQFSTVTFDPTIRSQQNYWGYRQPMNSPLLKVGDRARIIGLENLESIPTTFIHNTVNKSMFESTSTAPAEVDVVNAATIPLVNGDFYDLKQDIEIPAKVEILTRNDTPNAGDARLLGCNWINERFISIKARFLLDRERNIYSSPISPTTTSVTPIKDNELIIAVYADMTDREYSNLMVELSFTRVVNGLSSEYLMRQHFSRPVPADILSYGNYAVVPKKRGKVEIAKFVISKVVTPTSEDESKQKLVEEVMVTTDIVKPKENSLTLSDYCGNMYNPLGPVLQRPECTATKLQHIGGNNVRAYVPEELPVATLWKEGDQVVVSSANGSSLYILLGGTWCKLY